MGKWAEISFMMNGKDIFTAMEIPGGFKANLLECPYEIIEDIPNLLEKSDKREAREKKENHGIIDTQINIPTSLLFPMIQGIDNFSKYS